jgi:hypothetical protein
MASGIPEEGTELSPLLVAGLTQLHMPQREHLSSKSHNAMVQNEKSLFIEFILEF